VGKRSRQRAREDAQGLDQPLSAPTSLYTDAEGSQLELRGAMSPKARAGYARTLSGGRHQEDAWQRATELLFERLAVSWTISGLRLERQQELLGRYRMASTDERRFVRESLRTHLQQNFPELQAP
jgi:hypothetical protein